MELELQLTERFLQSSTQVVVFPQRLKRKHCSTVRSTSKIYPTLLSRDIRLNRRALIKCAAGAGLLLSAAVSLEAPAQGMDKLLYNPEGYSFWDWRGHKVHYVVQGEGSPIILIHGFGASLFHWRYNILELAKHFKVYAMDLLGFGWSEKALIDYDPSVWKDQITDFIKEIVQERSILVGNSVGGFTVLYTAASYPDLVSGVALLNASGRFESSESRTKEGLQVTSVQRLIWNPLKDWFQRIAIAFAFWQAKKPARIRSVLDNVYIDKTNVDDELVESIVHPTKDPNAGEVYYRLMTRVLFHPSNLTLDKLLSELTCPLLLLWGDLDPWMGASKVDKIRSLYPGSSVVRLQAGHCPHDEAPEAVNDALIKWASSIQAM